MALGAAVKGITIEFEANTTKLGTALKTIDNQTKGLDKNLKAVNTALKFNPGNTQLVAQKQQLLGEKIQQTKDKLEQLKKAQATLDDDPAVDKTSQEYMELQREIITTESKLKHFNAEMEKLKNIKFDELGQKFQDIGGKMTAVGEGMTKKVTAPIVGLGAASVKSFKDVDAGLDIMIQKTGASGKAAEAMKQTVKDLATSIPTDFETAGAAVGEVNTRFGVTGKELEKLSAKFVKFAKLNNTDVSTAVDTTQKAMAAFGIPTEKAGGFLDRLNKVGQDTGIGMDALTQSLTKNAPALKAMGMNADSAASFLGNLEKSGVDSSKVMTGLQKALVKGAEAGMTMPEVMEEVQAAIVGAKDETAALNVAADLFGSKAGPAIATAARSGALDFTELGKAAGNAAGSVDKTFEGTLDPIDKFKVAMNQAKVTGAEVGSSLLTILTPALEKISSTLQKVAKWWEGLSPGMQGFIIKLALVAAAVGPFLVVIGKMLIGFGTLIKLLPSIIKGFQLVGLAFKALGAAFSANPIILAVMAAILAVMAAIAVGILLYKNWDKVKKVLLKIWNSLSKAVSKAFGAIKKVVSGAWDGISKAAEKAWGGVKKAIETVVKAIATVLRFYVGIYKTVLSAAWDTIKSVATKAWSAISSAASKAWKGIKEAITKPITAAKDAVANAYDAMKKKVAEKVSAAASWVSDVKDKISGAIGKAKDAVNSGYDAMKKKVGEKVTTSSSWGTMKDTISGAVDKAKSAVSSAFESIKSAVNSKVSLHDSVTKLGSTIEGKVESVKKAAAKVKDAIVSKLSSFGLKFNFPSLESLKSKAKKLIGKIKIPSLKLPFKIPKVYIKDKGKLPYGIAGKGRMPELGVKWNKMGGIFTKPTIFDTRNGLQGVGEAGAEAILPLDRLFTEMNGMFASMADNIVNGLIQAQRMGATASDGGGEIHLDVYLYPSGPKMQEEVVRAYDKGKKILG